MFDYILALIIWLCISFMAAFAVVNLEVWGIIVVFSLVAAAVTVAYVKMSDRLENMEKSIQELKEMLRDKE